MPQTVLVGDDHEEMRHLIVQVLDRQGYDVREAANTQAVLDAFAIGEPDLVILDVQMPGGGGLQALAAIRSDPERSATPVLLLSGSVEALDADWAEKVGADAHLPKPFPIDQLNATVSALLSA